MARDEQRERASDNSSLASAAVNIVRIGSVCILGIAASVLGYLFLGGLALLGGSLVAGIVLASFVHRTRFAVVGAAGIAVVSVVLARQALATGLLAWLLENGIGRTSVPADVITKLLPYSAALQAGTIVATLSALMVGAGAAWLASKAFELAGERRWLVHLPAMVLLACVSVGMISGGSAVNPGKAAVTLREPGSFKYDAAIYRQAHILMVEQDLEFYEAFITAASQDARLIEEGAVQDGTFVSWATSPNFIRMPYLFWVWQSARAVGLTVYQLAMVAAAVLLVAAYWAFLPTFGRAAVIMPALLYPWFIAHATWVNLFFPDYWASMFALAAMLLVLRERWLAAGVAALAAALCREVAAIWIAFLIFGAVVALFDRADKRALRDLLFYLGCAAVFWLSVYLHHGPASALIATTVTAIPVSEMLETSAARSFREKFVAPGGHVMYPYGFFLFPPAGLVILAPLGFWFSLRQGPRRILATVLAACVFWLGFTLTIGAPSSYWGQQYTALAVLGSTALFVWLARQPCADLPARPYSHHA